MLSTNLHKYLLDYSKSKITLEQLKTWIDSQQFTSDEDLYPVQKVNLGFLINEKAILDEIVFKEDLYKMILDDYELPAHIDLDYSKTKLNRFIK